MRGETNREKLGRFMVEFGRMVQSPGSIYLTGGGTAVWEGWREMTIDIDLKASPEPAGFFPAIAQLKESLQLNIELASPDDFIPQLPGWEHRSAFIGRFGQTSFYHYDFYSQALAKLERGHARDLTDCTAMLDRKLIEPEKLWNLFLDIEPRLLRFPAIDPAIFRQAVCDFCSREDPPQA